MARPREFDIDDAIAGAMMMFWRQGFKATNLPELLEAMGVSRGSFYKAFTDKESVYLLALDRYDRVVVSDTLATLSACESPSPADCLAPLFAPSDDAERGCFICNAMVELAPDHEAVARITTTMADRLRDGIFEVLEARRFGATAQIRRDTADVILHLYFGHQALGKAGQRRSNWKERLERLLTENAGTHAPA